MSCQYKFFKQGKFVIDDFQNVYNYINDSRLWKT